MRPFEILSIDIDANSPTESWKDGIQDNHIMIHSFTKNNDSITIIADDREPRDKVIASLMGIKGVTVLIKRLSIGDYKSDNRLVFERKTLRDFAISIIDGRLFKQMIYPVKNLLINVDKGTFPVRNRRFL